MLRARRVVLRLSPRGGRQPPPPPPLRLSCRCLASASARSASAAAGAGGGKQQQQQPSGPAPVAKQVRTDRGHYRATLYYPVGAAPADAAASSSSSSSSDAGAAAAGAAGGGSVTVLQGLPYSKVEPPAEKLSLQVLAEDGLRALLPRGYPRSVQKGYADYVKLQMTASLASSAIGVLSTQSLLYAMGLGAGSVPLAAALNWIIKDGIGQVGGIVFASVVNDRFDANPKRWKMVATISLDASCALELLAPLAPGYFLAIASLANIGKNICFLSASASRAAIHNSFAKRENLADITAKAGSQFIVTSILGTGLGILLSSALGSSWTALAPICATLSLVHISCNYISLRHVCLNTVNAERMELIMERYLASGRVPHPGEISSLERFMSPAVYDTISPSAAASGIPSLRMGRPLEDVISLAASSSSSSQSQQQQEEDQDQLPRLARFFAKDMYILNARGRAADKTAVVDVLMKEGATVDDVLRACVHAYYCRRAAAASGWRAPPLPGVMERALPAAAAAAAGRGNQAEAMDTWLFDLVEETYTTLHAPPPAVTPADQGGGGGVTGGKAGAAAVMEDVMRQLAQAGWLLDSVFFPHTQNRVSIDVPALTAAAAASQPSTQPSP